MEQCCGSLLKNTNSKAQLKRSLPRKTFARNRRTYKLQDQETQRTSALSVFSVEVAITSTLRVVGLQTADSLYEKNLGCLTVDLQLRALDTVIR